MLWAAGAALVAGLLLIYVPLSRHPATLLVVGVALLATGLIAPEPTLLLAQAASLGLALTLLAGMLERGVARRRRFVAHKDFSGSRIEVGSSARQLPIGACRQSALDRAHSAHRAAIHRDRRAMSAEAAWLSSIAAMLTGLVLVAVGNRLRIARTRSSAFIASLCPKIA